MEISQQQAAKIIHTLGTCLDNGRKWAVTGSLATCGECKGSFLIFGSAHDTTDEGRTAVVDGDLVLCPCRTNHVVAGSDAGCFTEVDDDSDSASYKQERSEQPDNELAHYYDDRFQLLDAQTGEPLANLEYAIVRATGEIEYGVTDLSGHTHLLSSTADSESVNIYM
ncbi:PAAR domain-containing protein [Paraburkholderia dilworthii]|uniref:PAAR domain-containing protein n=1 Tax=Paraburkholderia dilworthii TaxID=948106 RepID=UPI001ADFB699|nr:PAAR domain-containing protein [Paraburkholderia dilworthii]